MKLLRIKNKNNDSADSVVARKSRVGNEADQYLLSQAEAVYTSFRNFREKRARIIRFVYEDQWGDSIVVNGKTMTQREYLSRHGYVVLQANLMASKANSIAGSHIKEGAMPSIHSRSRAQQTIGEILSETLKANWEANDMGDLEVNWEQELLFGGMAVCRESFERVNGEEDAHSRAVNPNMFAFRSSMQDSRMLDVSMTVELHDFNFNDLCAAFAESPEDYKRLLDWYHDESSPLRIDDEIDVSEQLDAQRVNFLTPVNSKDCRVIEVWTKERRPRYHVFDPQLADYYDINADDKELLKEIDETNESRKAEGKRLGYADDEIPIIEKHYFIDTYYYCRFLTPKGYILYEGESELPGRTLPYTICAAPFVNGKICGFMSDAVDLQLALNRELVVYDWMKRLGAKGVTFVPQDIIPDGMGYDEFAEQWTSMDGIVFYKPNNKGDKPFTEHSSLGHLNTAEMVKMLSDTMADSVSVSGAIQGKTPYAGTSAQLYAQQKENSTTPIAVVANKLESFLKHVAIKKTEFIKMYSPIDRYMEVAEGLNVDWSQIDFSQIQDLRYKFKFILGADHTSLRQESNELLINMMSVGALTAADVLELGEFQNADAIIAKMNENAMRMQEQQQIGDDYSQKQQMFRRNQG